MFHLNFRALGLILCLLLVTSTLFAGETHVFFGPPMEEGQPTLADHFIEYINGAKETLDCCFFDIKHQPIVDAFLQAAARGVKLRFVTDDDRYFLMEKGKQNKDKFRDTVQQLKDAGIEVRHDGRSPLMHNKFCIKDGRYVWTGSFNITDPGTFNNTNNALWAESKDLAAIYQLEFIEMFEEGQYGKESFSLVEEQKLDMDGKLWEVYFAPEDNPNGRILELVKKATDSVYFLHYAFTADTIGDELVNKKQEGLKIEGIFDHLLYRSTGPHSEFSKLVAADIPVSVLRPKGGIQHNKVFIIDPETDHGVVVMGSLNISDSGGDANDENTIIIHDSKVAMQYYEEYKRRRVQCSETVTAGVMYDELPVVKSNLEKVQVHIVTNSTRVAGIQIEFPARWKLKPESFQKARILRGTEQIPADQVEMDYKSQKLTIPNVDLHAIGENKNLLIEIRDVDTPAIEGIYTVTVRTRKDGSNEYVPLSQQPTIEVWKAKNEEHMEDQLARLDQLLDNLMALDVVASTEATQIAILKDYHEQFAGLEPIIMGDTMDGDYTRLTKMLEYVEASKNYKSLIYKAIIEKLENAVKIISSQAMHQNDLAAHKLALRVKRALAKYGKQVG